MLMSAIALVRELLERIADSKAFLPRYDCLINKSRAANLKRYLHRLERNELHRHLTSGPSENWPHYAAAGLLFIWILLDTDIHRAHTWPLAVAFGLGIALTIAARNHALRKMLALDTEIQKLLEGNRDVARSEWMPGSVERIAL
jgi:hypothetical protein